MKSLQFTHISLNIGVRILKPQILEYPFPLPVTYMSVRLSSWKAKSTQLTVFNLLKHICSALNNRKIFGSVFLDISKAFDCINHSILLSKLDRLGLSDASIAWFSSSLNRMQELTYNDITSSTLAVQSGIGQATIIGPIVFLLYIYL